MGGDLACEGGAIRARYGLLEVRSDLRMGRRGWGGGERGTRVCGAWCVWAGADCGCATKSTGVMEDAPAEWLDSGVPGGRANKSEDR